MAKRKGLEILEILGNESFSFEEISVIPDLSNEGKRVFVFHLSEPKSVTSKTAYVNELGQREFITKTVSTVICREDDFNSSSDSFEFDEETKEGSYSGKGLVLDLQKSGVAQLGVTSVGEYRKIQNEERRMKSSTIKSALQNMVGAKVG